MYIQVAILELKNTFSAMVYETHCSISHNSVRCGIIYNQSNSFTYTGIFTRILAGCFCFLYEIQ